MIKIGDENEEAELSKESKDIFEETKHHNTPFDYNSSNRFSAISQSSGNQSIPRYKSISKRCITSLDDSISQSLGIRTVDYRIRIKDSKPTNYEAESSLQYDHFQENRTNEERLSMGFNSEILRNNRSRVTDIHSHVELPYYSKNDSESKIIKLKSRNKNKGNALDSYKQTANQVYTAHKEKILNKHVFKKPLIQHYNLEDDHQSLQIIPEPEVKLEDDSGIILNQDNNSTLYDTASISHNHHPSVQLVQGNVLNSLSKLPPKYIAPKKKKNNDLNLLIYKPHEISRIHVDRKKFVLDKDFGFRVKQQQYHENIERDMALRHSVQSSLTSQEMKLLSPEETINRKFNELLHRKPQLFFS